MEADPIERADRQQGQVVGHLATAQREQLLEQVRARSPRSDQHRTHSRHRDRHTHDHPADRAAPAASLGSPAPGDESPLPAHRNPEPMTTTRLPLCIAVFVPVFIGDKVPHPPKPLHPKPKQVPDRVQGGGTRCTFQTRSGPGGWYALHLQTRSGPGGWYALHLPDPLGSRGVVRVAVSVPPEVPTPYTRCGFGPPEEVVWPERAVAF
jgi:hypothetical protein